MTQSLPSICYIGYLHCSELPPDILNKYLAGMLIAINASPTPIEIYGDASCEAVSEYDNGSRLEKTTLQFSTADEVPECQDLAFVVKDVQGKEYVIGQKESPFPTVEIDTSINKEENDQMVKVMFIAKKSLIPCRF